MQNRLTPIMLEEVDKNKELAYSMREFNKHLPLGIQVASVPLASVLFTKIQMRASRFQLIWADVDVPCEF